MHDDENWNLDTNDHGLTDDLFITNVVLDIKNSDPRAGDEDFIQAKTREVEGQSKRQVWKVVKNNAVPDGANIIGGRFVLVLKDVETPQEMPKARYVAQGFSDKMKHEMVHNVTSLRPAPVRFILSTAANPGFWLYFHDMVQAYLQSLAPPSREVFLQPKQEDHNILRLQHEEMLLLRKPLYGMCDAGDYWYATICEHLRSNLSMTPCTTDLSLWIRIKDGRLVGIEGNYVDDNLNAGTKKSEYVTDNTLEMFETKPREYDNLLFF